MHIATFWGRKKWNKSNFTSFHALFAEGLHQGGSDWEVRLIDQGVSVDNLR